jgi:DNA-binding NarL/FixJ family response regulator
MTVRVVLADDQDLVRTGVRMILEAEDDFEIVGEARDGSEAIAKCRRLRPDVVVMDIRMPVLDGVEATRQLSALDPPLPTRVLVLTTYDLDEYVFAALRAGASGFLLKDAPPEDLIHAIRVIAGGEALLAPSVTRRLIEELARAGGGPIAVADDVRLARLTAREEQVLVQMARGLSNAEIAEHLHLGEATIKTHVGRVLMKLDVRDRVQAVVLAYELGLVRPGV